MQLNGGFLLLSAIIAALAGQGTGGDACATKALLEQVGVAVTAGYLLGIAAVVLQLLFTIPVPAADPEVGVRPILLDGPDRHPFKRYAFVVDAVQCLTATAEGAADQGGGQAVPGGGRRPRPRRLHQR